MPGKKVRAADLIAERSAGGLVLLNAEQKAELHAVLYYNDKVSRNRRVGRRAVLPMLAGMGWHGGEDALNKVCQIQFRRKSFAQP